MTTTKPHSVALRMGHLTNDIYLAAIQKLEKTIVKKKKMNKVSEMRKENGHHKATRNETQENCEFQIFQVEKEPSITSKGAKSLKETTNHESPKQEKAKKQKGLTHISTTLGMSTEESDYDGESADGGKDVLLSKDKYFHKSSVALTDVVVVDHKGRRDKENLQQRIIIPGHLPEISVKTAAKIDRNPTDQPEGEGEKRVESNLSDEIPVQSTTTTHLATGHPPVPLGGRPPLPSPRGDDPEVIHPHGFRSGRSRSDSDLQKLTETRSDIVHLKMNYLKRRFQRPSSAIFNTETVLRDIRSKRNGNLSIGDRLTYSDAGSSCSSTKFSNPGQVYKSDKLMNSPETSCLRQDVRRSRNRNSSSVSDQHDRKSTTNIRSRNLRAEPSIKMEAKVPQRSPAPVSSSSLDAHKSEVPSIKVSLTKSSSLRRRRRDSGDDHGDDELANPTKKGNYSVAFDPPLANESGDKSDVDDKILDSIEIKSAAQWKVMSQRVTFKNLREDIPNNFTIHHSDAASSDLEGFQPTKVQQLRLICWKVKPWKQSKVGNKLFSSQFAMGWGVDCDEVYPGLFIGDKASATNLQFLQKIGITHVLNTAEGKDEGLVDLNQDHYYGTDIQYMGFPLWDTPDCNLIPYFGCAAEFISNAIDNGGKCLVNCQMGVSRSSTCAMVYLMIKKKMEAIEVMNQFRHHRDIRPNDGFLEQIVLLDNHLRKHRNHGEPLTIQLSTLADHKRLPQAWNYEFWRKPVTCEEIGLPLVKLGEPCPLLQGSLCSSRRSSRILSRRSSKKSLDSRLSSKSISRHSSFKKSLSERINSKIESGSRSSDEEEEDYEWVWEDEEQEEPGDANSGGCNQLPRLSLTTEKLEQVKDIIEKPEERWRVLWQTSRTTDSPSSLGSMRSLASSNASSLLSNASRVSNIIQPGLDDPLSAVKVGSAREWKAMSQSINIDLDGIDLGQDHGANAVNMAERPSTPSEYKPTTVQQLRLICWRIKPWEYPRARNLFSSVLARGWGVDCDEVFPNLFIGDEASARNIRFLQKLGITHVLNTAEGRWTDCSFVDLSPQYYEDSSITYQGIQLWDSNKVRILPYFGLFNEFIKQAIKGGGKCLVHCQMGVSRSCTAAMVYMMLTEGWDALDVMMEFRKRRDVRPNDHFLAQVVELDNDLRKEKLFHIPRSLKLYGLSDLPRLPRPWHYEFWDSLPDPETLPFKLCHIREDCAHLEEAANATTEGNTGCEGDHESNQVSLPSAPGAEDTKSELSSECSDWEWEYYDNTESDEEECDSEVIDEDYKVNCARDWREVSVRISSGDIKVRKVEEIKNVDDTAALEKHLRLLCWRIKPWAEPKSSRMFSSQFAMLWKVDCDEVHPNLFIGDKAAASNIRFLQHLKITHVLNTAEGIDENLVDLTEEYFVGTGITYKGFLMWDSTWFDVEPFISCATEFIDEAIKSGGRCLVNCQMGVSRSSTCAMAYMMIKLGFTVSDALRQFRTHRDVRPNDGFLRYLVKLDNELRRKSPEH